MKKSSLFRLQTIVFSAVGVILLALLAFLGIRNNIEVQERRADEGLTPIQNVAVSRTEDADAPIGFVTEFSFTLDPSLAHDTNLVFYTSHCYVDVYIDGENVYSLRLADDIPFLKTAGSNWSMIPLYREDAGREVRVVTTPVYEGYSAYEIEFLTGSSLAVYTLQLSRSMWELVLSLFIILAGLIFLGTAVYHFLTKRRIADIFALGLFAVMIGLWRFMDTMFTPFLAEDKPVFLYYVSLTMLMVCMIPLVKSVKRQTHERKSHILDYWCIGVAVICIMQFLLQIFGVLDLRETLLLTHCVILSSTLLVIGCTVYERRKYPHEHKRFIDRSPLWFLGVGALADLTVFYIRGTSSGLLFILFAILCYMAVEGVRFVLLYTEQSRLLAEKEMQLSNSRVTTMMNQFRSHFVFNILNAISGMCKYDPEKADEIVVRFSRYLRSNIDITQEDKPIPFLSDLRHLEDYVALEQVRFGSRVRFVTDITEEQFMVPPLILQPLVENAIKHGLSPKRSGGVITLRTWKDAEDIWISIKDDGVGFDVNAPCDDRSVGVKNVRFRLQHLMNGRLEIESRIGLGTTVTISIPRKEAERCE